MPEKDPRTPKQLSYGADGELVWDEEYAETKVLLSSNGTKLLESLGLNPINIAQLMAIDGFRRIQKHRNVNDPKFILPMARGLYPEDAEKCWEVIDRLTDLMTAGELRVEYYGKVRE